MNSESEINQFPASPASGKRSLSNLIFIIPMIVATVTATVIAVYYAVNRYESYSNEIEKLKSEFPIQQKRELKFRILSTLEYIHFAKDHPETYINKYLQKQAGITKQILLLSSPVDVKDTFAVSRETYDSLRQMYKGSGFRFVVTDRTGQPVLSSESDSSAFIKRSSLWDHTKAQLLAGNNLDLKVDWPGPVHHSQAPLVYTIPLADSHYNLHIVSYPADSIQLLQECILDSLSSVRFENGEYIFINTFDGKGLITKGQLQKSPLSILEGKDRNWIRIFKEELEFANKEGGGYIIYNWQKDPKTSYSEKVSYINGIKEWKWILGTGMHTNDILPLLQKQKDALWDSYSSEFIRFIAFISISYVLIYLITRLITTKTKNNLHLFVRFFRNAAKSQLRIDESKIHFSEFHKLAIAANQMIDDRERIMKDLSTEQSRLRYIIDSIPDLIFIKDTSSRFVGGNRAFEKFIGRKVSEIIGLSEYDLFSKTNADSYIESDRKLLETLEPVRTTEWVTYPDGQKVLCDTLKTLYFDAEGNVLGFIGISRDISEMEETKQRLILAKEKAEDSDRLKTAFLANMSHEIRTPMNAIIGFSDLLADEELGKPEREDFISKIKLSGESLMNIINDIIDISKIEAGQLKISDSECNVDKILADLYGTFFEVRNRTHKTELELKLTTENHGEPLLTITDPLRLQQVLNNLLSNALKFTEFGTVEFGYKLEESNIHFYVKDTGIGILRSKQPLLFQRFSQVDTSKTRKYGGTGLGLAISKNIVELMGGNIWLESEPGKGSTFHFTLPYRPPQEDSTEPPSSDNLYQWKGKKILIAEDIDQNFLLMEAVLRFTQVTLLHAPNGQVAIDLAAQHPDINLVLMDIQLPVKTGYEAIQEIRQFRPDLPIISFTAYALPREREKSLEAGCVDFLNKPIKPNMLLNVIRKYIL